MTCVFSLSFFSLLFQFHIFLLYVLFHIRSINLQFSFSDFRYSILHIDTVCILLLDTPTCPSSTFYHL